MSAIWGAIDLNGEKVDKVIAEKMKHAFLECVIDRYEEILQDNVYMGCGIQYVTVEAEKEILPIHKEDIFFTADVIIDNRTQIIERLGIKETKQTIPDGTLLHSMLKKYGKVCLNDLLGAYAFVWYEKERNEIILSGDAIGNRYIYYMLQDHILYFASLMKPLEQLKKGMKLNERWIADFLAQDNLMIFTESEQTPIEGIYRIAPAQVITINMRGIKKKQYWLPRNQPGKIRFQTEEEYKDSFLKLYQECVCCLLRSPKETAIYLSGGFDSSSVAAFAAKELKKGGKKLYSYTSVPCKEFGKENDSKNWIDESDAVKKIQEMYPNIECNFMELSGMDGWHERNILSKICEIPYKSTQNLLWIIEGAKLAYSANSRIMLGGMYGNSTVSFGDLPLYLVYLFRRGRFVSLYREIREYHLKRNYSRKGMLLVTIKRGLQKYAYQGKKQEFYDKAFINKEYIKEYGSAERVWKRNRLIQRCMNDYTLNRKLQFTNELLRHDGEFFQKESLYTGVIVRDPTKDKRMIEYTLAIPYAQMNKEAIQRRLISVYMKELIPESILTEKRRGEQSADMKERIIKYQEEIKTEWMTTYESYKENGRVDCEKALNDLKHRSLEEMERFELVRHISTYILLDYVNRKEKK